MAEKNAYVPRILDGFLTQVLQGHPGILITGPRGVGKTRTATQVAASRINLDDRTAREITESDPRSALNRPFPLLIDEWQLFPDVLWTVKRIIDEEGQPGMFIVTGSMRNDLVVNQSAVTGRLIRVRMWGMVVRERFGLAGAMPLFDRWDNQETRFSLPPELPDLRDYLEMALEGGLPEALATDSQRARKIMVSYVDSVITSDLPALAAPGTRPKEPSKFRHYLESYALNTAGVVPHNTIYDPIGINHRTALSYLEVLTSLGIVDELPPWAKRNRGRLISERAKRYFVDAGLAAAATGLTIDDLYRDTKLLGSFLDTFVTAQLRVEAEMSQNTRLYHLRTAKGDHEIDVVAQRGQQLIAFEIKAGRDATRDDIKHLRWFRDEVGPERFAGGVLFYTGTQLFQIDQGIQAVPIAGLWGPGLPMMEQPSLPRDG